MARAKEGRGECVPSCTVQGYAPDVVRADERLAKYRAEVVGAPYRVSLLFS